MKIGLLRGSLRILEQDGVSRRVMLALVLKVERIDYALDQSWLVELDGSLGGWGDIDA